MKKNVIKMKAIFIGFAIASVAIIAGCSKENLSQSEQTPGEILKATPKNPIVNANAAYDGFIRAFVVRSGGQTYIVDGLNKRSRAYFWGQGFMITSMIDAFEKTRTQDRKQLVIDLLNSFITNETKDWSWNSWSDDIAWATIPMIRGYLITGDNNYLSIAKTNWDFCYHRGWDNVVGGGIWENMDKHTKAALSNGPMIIAGMYIYEATGDVWYLDRCKEIYSWYRGKLFNPGTGQVNEAVVNDGSIQYSDNSYNCGSFVNAASALYKVTNDVNYLNDAKIAADHILNKWPVMTQEADGCVRGIARLARENNLESRYYPWLQNQCVAAWNSRRTDYNITNNNWKATTAAGEQYAMECVSAVTVQSVTPEAGTEITSGTTYSLLSRNSGKAMDVEAASVNDGAKVLQWTNSNANNQKWIISNVGGYAYTIISKNSNKALDIAGGSIADGALVDQWGYNGGKNQKWFFVPDGQGYYTIISAISGKALDVSGASTADGASILQWTVNGGNNQKWSFVK